MGMDYRLRHSKAELDSTGYMEIGPGKYTGSHWQDGFVFVWEDAFGVAEGIVEKHFPDYDHMGMNDVPRHAAVKIISEWKAVADRLPGLDPSEIQREMNLVAPHFAGLAGEVESDRLEVSGFLRSLANECENFVQQSDWMCILGM
jgi:hypothetical protein